MAEEKQVLVRFVTKLPPDLHVPATEVVSVLHGGGCWDCCQPLSLLLCGTGACLAVLGRRHRAVSSRVTLVFLQAVPASLKRYGLSQIINHLLALGEGASEASMTRPVSLCAMDLQWVSTTPCSVSSMHTARLKLHSP